MPTTGLDSPVNAAQQEFDSYELLLDRALEAVLKRFIDMSEKHDNSWDSNDIADDRNTRFAAKKLAFIALAQALTDNDDQSACVPQSTYDAAVAVASL